MEAREDTQGTNNPVKAPDRALTGVFQNMEKYGHEQLIFNYDRATGLKAIIAIHDTRLGPAIGGCRMWNYDTEQEAVEDALRLSQGMTYKYAIAGFSYGGGKAVIWGDPHIDKSDEWLQAFGTFVETLKGRFVVGTDVGIDASDLVAVRKQTRYVVGLPEAFGGVGSTAFITAFGVLQGMKASVKEVFGSDSLNGRTIAVQGLGKVGKELIRLLLQEQTKIVAADMAAEHVAVIREQHPEVEIVSPDAIYSVDCDIFSPCALGGVVNDETIPLFKCRVICGSANNVLEDDRHAKMLEQRGILYAPDFVVNGGGMIHGLGELEGYNEDWAVSRATQIYDTLLRVYQIAKEEQSTTAEAANRLAEKRIQILQQITSKYLGE